MIRVTGEEHEGFVSDERVRVFWEEVVPEFLPEAQAAFKEHGGSLNPWLVIAGLIAAKYHPKMKVSRPANRPLTHRLPPEWQPFDDMVTLARIARHKARNGLNVTEVIQDICAARIKGVIINSRDFDDMRTRRLSDWKRFCKDPKQADSFLDPLEAAGL